ncbi:hypothetical protein FGG79_01390 [Bacillus sp. BHET2]|uniref:hypothetical protein n=1 Tax=Bacillus sp. BHET2 TaxID=2583818 RepID=UPI00110F4720|nr:hypothetical protein [Bacillus sp. BHET2]TMU86829.1 hypothetical protein FGG79_01390 [Bacillus sp. BHET2]
METSTHIFFGIGIASLTTFPFKATWIYSHQKSIEKSYAGWFHHPIHFKRIKRELVNELNK